MSERLESFVCDLRGLEIAFAALEAELEQEKTGNKIKIIRLGAHSMEIERDGVRETFWDRPCNVVVEGQANEVARLQALSERLSGTLDKLGQAYNEKQAEVGRLKEALEVSRELVARVRVDSSAV